MVREAQAPYARPMWLVISLAAQATEPAPQQVAPVEVPTWRHQLYAQPRLNARMVGVNGRSFGQAIVGAEAGVRYDHGRLVEVDGDTLRGRADLVGRTRVRADVFYGMSSGSMGYGLRLGSFIGPTTKAVTYQIGPDLWATQYGAPTALDYHLPFSLGLALQNVVVFHIDPAVSLQAGVIPGWAFAGPRQTGGIGPFHELAGYALVSLRMNGFAVDVGYRREYNAAGVFDGLILSGGR